MYGSLDSIAEASASTVSSIILFNFLIYLQITLAFSYIGTYEAIYKLPLRYEGDNLKPTNGIDSGPPHIILKYFPNISKEVTDDGWTRFYAEWEDLCIEMDKVTQNSPLPEDYDGWDGCNKILLSQRFYSLYQVLSGIKDKR